jgi:hypothetical protein
MSSPGSDPGYGIPPQAGSSNTVHDSGVVGALMGAEVADGEPRRC